MFRTLCKRKEKNCIINTPRHIDPFFYCSRVRSFQNPTIVSLNTRKNQEKLTSQVFQTMWKNTTILVFNSN